jgi:hypothetical protein
MNFQLTFGFSVVALCAAATRKAVIRVSGGMRRALRRKRVLPGMSVTRMAAARPKIVSDLVLRLLDGVPEAPYSRVTYRLILEWRARVRGVRAL